MLLESAIVMSFVIVCLLPLKKNMIPCREIRVICRHCNLHYTEMLNTWLFSLRLPFSVLRLRFPTLNSTLSTWMMFSFLLLLFDFGIKLQSERFLWDISLCPSSHPDQFMSTFQLACPFHCLLLIFHIYLILRTTDRDLLKNDSKFQLKCVDFIEFYTVVYRKGHLDHVNHLCLMAVDAFLPEYWNQAS